MLPFLCGLFQGKQGASLGFTKTGHILVELILTVVEIIFTVVDIRL